MMDRKKESCNTQTNFEAIGFYECHRRFRDIDMFEALCRIQKENAELKAIAHIMELADSPSMKHICEMAQKIEQERDALKSQLSKAVEIFQLATENIHEISRYYGICQYCNSYNGRCTRGYTVNCSFCNDWKWVHDDLLQEFGGGNE